VGMEIREEEFGEGTDGDDVDKKECRIKRQVKKAGQPFVRHVRVPHEETVMKVLDFLAYCSSQKERLNGEPSIFNAYIDHYLRFLQLKVKYPDIRLIPTLEVEWVWYSHILRPRFYEAYCNTKYGFIIPHLLEDWILGHKDPNALLETADLFKQEFGEEYIFESIPLFDTKEIKYLETADIYNDWNWYEKIKTLDKFPSEEFLEEGKQGYHKFLLSIMEEGFRYGPPINIDLWWHSHQCFPQQYIDDCMEMYGEVIYHTPLGTVGRWQDFKSYLTVDARRRG